MIPSSSLQPRTIDTEPHSSQTPRQLFQRFRTFWVVHRWTRSHSWEDLAADFVAGLTVTTIALPQAVAYAFLAGLPAEYGLYSSIVPVLVYALLGTSKYMHVGTFALTSLMIGTAVSDILQDNSSFSNVNGMYVYNSTSEVNSTELENASVQGTLFLTLFVGLMQIAMGISSLGKFVAEHLMPDNILSGFTAGAAVHVCISQLKPFLGVAYPTVSGPFSVFRNLKLAIVHVPQLHLPTLVVGCSSVILLVLFRILHNRRKSESENTPNEEEENVESEEGAKFKNPSSVESNIVSSAILRPYDKQTTMTTVRDEENWCEEDKSVIPAIKVHWIKRRARATSSEIASWLRCRRRKTKCPPLDVLIVVVIATFASWCLSLSSKHGVAVLGTIPPGVRRPSWPISMRFVSAMGGPLSALLSFLPAATGLAGVSFVVSIAIVKTFSQKHEPGQIIPYNREVLALGFASSVGSCFGAFVCCGSLTRSAVLESAGGKSSLASVFSALGVVVGSVWLTQFLAQVPQSSLAAVVGVSMFGLIRQVKEFFVLLNGKSVVGSRVDSFFWGGTFLVVLVVGLEAGIIFLLLSTGVRKVIGREGEGRQEGEVDVEEEEEEEEVQLVAMKSGGYSRL